MAGRAPDAPRELALAASLALTVLTGNVARPLGALLFGHLGDRPGRKTALVWNTAFSPRAGCG